jgi:hypothetical protein
MLNKIKYLAIYQRLGKESSNLEVVENQSVTKMSEARGGAPAH